MEFGKAKMWVSLIGGTATAVATCAATVVATLDDGAWDFEEYGLMATAVATLVGTVRAVWAATNKPLTRDSVR